MRSAMRQSKDCETVEREPWMPPSRKTHGRRCRHTWRGVNAGAKMHRLAGAKMRHRSEATKEVLSGTDGGLLGRAERSSPIAA
jgi:hypothetical protein